MTVCTHKDSKRNRGNCSTDESFPGFLRWQFDERRSAEEESEHVRHDVITDDHWHWNQKPAQIGMQL